MSSITSNLATLHLSAPFFLVCNFETKLDLDPKKIETVKLKMAATNTTYYI